MEKFLDYEYMKKEHRYSAFQYQGYTEKGKPFLYREGELPVLISVPHATFHMREGEMKLPELFTGAIGELLHSYLGVYLIVKCSSIGEDPNYSPNSIYRDKVQEIIKQNNIRLVIDLHGAREHHPFCIDIGTASGKTVKPETIQVFREAFMKNGEFTIVQDHTFSAPNPNTVTHDIFNKTKCEIMQLEINRKYRRPNEDFESFTELFRNLVRFILYFSKTIE